MNLLTSNHSDKATHTPAYKEASVRMEALPEIGESPLPRVNSRFGHPTPQNGLEIERKWKRSDYHLPGSQPTVFHATKKSANGSSKSEAQH